MHTQQNSCLHFLHVMWLQPPFFSMMHWHFGQSCVLALSQLQVSESSSHFFFHTLTIAQLAGACVSTRHSVQNMCPRWHVTNLEPPEVATDRPQSGYGHQMLPEFPSTNACCAKSEYFFSVDWLHTDWIRSSVTLMWHLSAGHLTRISPSVTFMVRYCPQHVSQYACPHDSALTTILPLSLQIPQSKSSAHCEAFVPSTSSPRMGTPASLHALVASSMYFSRRSSWFHLKCRSSSVAEELDTPSSPDTDSIASFCCASRPSSSMHTASVCCSPSTSSSCRADSPQYASASDA
mmetsp:Transcript_12954/g.40899  ORF Transcript_12954/g.40899 Transcript_12954/m.40899 type:complete len:292 (+) Transcript_12954:210-1085(+)